MCYVSCTPDTQSNTSVRNVLNACKNHTGWNRIGKNPNLQFIKHTCDLETRSRSSNWCESAGLKLQVDCKHAKS